MPPLLPPDPPLTDGRVLLRSWRDEDVPWLARASRDPLVARHTTVPRDNTEDDVRAFLLAQDPLRTRGEQLHLLGVEAGTGAPFGPVGLHHVDWTHRRAEIGYWTARHQRGHGLTTAGVRLLCDWALGPLGLGRIELRTHLDNEGSRRIAERCGFRREGVLRDAELGPEGRRSVLLYGLLAGELT